MWVCFDIMMLIGWLFIDAVDSWVVPALFIVFKVQVVRFIFWIRGLLVFSKIPTSSSLIHSFLWVYLDKITITIEFTYPLIHWAVSRFTL